MSSFLGSIRRGCCLHETLLVHRLLKKIGRQTTVVAAGDGVPCRGQQHRRRSSSAPAAPTQEEEDDVEAILMMDPGRLVSGLTREQINADPAIAEFLRANFEGRRRDGSSGISVPAEILKEFGIVEGEDSFPDGEGVASSETKKYGDPRVDAGLGSPEQQLLNIRVLKSFLRSEDEEGSRSSRRLRGNDRMIPGLLYGGHPTRKILSLTPSSKTLLKTPWPELQRELDRYHRRFESRVYDLTVYDDDENGDTDGTVHRVLPRNIQRHPVQGKIYCANFVRYHPGRPIRIPLKYINIEESPALKRDGYIIPVGKHVECLVEDGVPIPDALEVECSGLVLKDVVRMDRVIFPDGVKMSERMDVENFVVGPVRGGRGAAEDVADEGGESK